MANESIKTYKVVRKYMVIETYEDVKAFTQAEAILTAAVRRTSPSKIERLHLSDDVYEETPE